jgi:hypothetical protein
MEEPNKSDLERRFNFFWNRRMEILSGLLMLVGLILCFFYPHIGGALVGLAVGICFFIEIQTFVFQFLDIYSEQGIFKTLMILATILYFLIAVPAFIIATAIGFGAIFVIRLSLKK